MLKDKQRDSNLELFRIILMLVIVAHHYVVNSGVTEYYNFSDITPNMIFLQLFGFSGKIGINCFMHDTWDYVSWLVVIYLIGGYIRLYPDSFKYSSGKWFVCTGILIMISWLSVIVVDYIGVRFGFGNYYHMVNNCHKLFAVLIAVSAFLAFKNMKLKYNKFINTVASATFGVLLIHANSDTMRQFLWKDILNVDGQYESGTLWLHAILSVMGVYVVCVVIDLLRIYFIETPLFKVLDKKINWNVDFLSQITQSDIRK